MSRFELMNAAQKRGQQVKPQSYCARCNQPCASGERTCASPECNAGPRALDAMEIDPARARAVAEILDRMERRRQWGYR